MKDIYNTNFKKRRTTVPKSNYTKLGVVWVSENRTSREPMLTIKIDLEMLQKALKSPEFRKRYMDEYQGAPQVTLYARLFDSNGKAGYSGSMSVPTDVVEDRIAELMENLPRETIYPDNEEQAEEREVEKQEWNSEDVPF